VRAILLIFAILGLLVIGSAVVIGTGVVHLTALNPIAPPQLAGGSATRPADGDDGDAGTTQPAGGITDADDPADPDPGPTMASRSVFLAAAEAKLAGPTIALIDRNSQVLRNGFDAGGPGGFDRGDRGMGWGRRRSPRTFQPFITRWNSDQDVAEWTFPSPGAGTYAVTVVYAGPPARGDDAEGSPFVITTNSTGSPGPAGGEPLVVHLKPTARPTTFEMADAGTLSLPAGEVRLSIHPEGKQTNREQIHLRSVRLFPAK
jgi:hypothetical protein